MNSSETVREAIFALLKPTSTPLTATELRIRLRVKALKLAEYEVLHALRYLRSEGLVRLERGRWSATAPLANASVLGQQRTSLQNDTGHISTVQRPH